jgi:serine/threonine protein kinase
MPQVIITPLAELGCLEHYIKQRQAESDVSDGDDDFAAEALQEPLCWAMQIAFGVEFLHHFAVIHGDLKPKNVLVFRCRFSGEFDVTLKLCDLGQSIPADRKNGGLLGPRGAGRGTAG